MSSCTLEMEYKKNAHTLSHKKSLQLLYLETYQKYVSCLKRCPPDGLVIEIGSGASFVKDVIPEIVTSDIVSLPGVDKVIDAKKLPFEDGSVRALFMCNVFHHIANVEIFLSEAQRCLKTGGRLFMVDQHRGLLSRWIYRYAHKENYDEKTLEWNFSSQNPFLDANGALPWIVFQRDQDIFKKKYPGLKVEGFSPHSPLRYWLSGGLKSWTLLPGRLFGLATRLDEGLIKLCPDLGSFVDIEIVKGVI